MEQNHTPTSPIAGEPASVNALVLGLTKQHEAIMEQYHGLMSLRSTLHAALWDFANNDGLPVGELPWEIMAHDLASAVQSAHEQVTAMLGITEPADDNNNPLTPVSELIEASEKIDEAEQMPVKYEYCEKHSDQPVKMLCKGQGNGAVLICVKCHRETYKW